MRDSGGDDTNRTNTNTSCVRSKANGRRSRKERESDAIEIERQQILVKKIESNVLLLLLFDFRRRKSPACGRRWWLAVADGREQPRGSVWAEKIDYTS